jgi:ubiquinone/menaquinone biosynthesis C-methylase UbiE
MKPQDEIMGIRGKSDYDDYVRAEWTLFFKDQQRAVATLEVLAGITVSKVLDVGCGAGQELFPLVTTKRAFGVGVDAAPEAGHAARTLFTRHAPDAQVAFIRSTAEALPFQSETFDVVICRLALPYTDNSSALAEFARVLRPGGVLLLKVHSAHYYLRKFRRGLRSRDLRSMAHAARVLVTGTLYLLTGRQPRSRMTGLETFQTWRMMIRYFERDGLLPSMAMPDSKQDTPSYLITKSTAAKS